MPKPFGLCPFAQFAQMPVQNAICPNASHLCKMSFCTCFRFLSPGQLPGYLCNLCKMPKPFGLCPFAQFPQICGRNMPRAYLCKMPKPFGLWHIYTNMWVMPHFCKMPKPFGLWHICINMSWPGPWAGNDIFAKCFAFVQTCQMLHFWQKAHRAKRDGLLPNMEHDGFAELKNRNRDHAELSNRIRFIFWGFAELNFTILRNNGFGPIPWKDESKTRFM